MIATRDDIVGLDAAIIMQPRVWEVSGHVENFTDPLVDCKECKQRFRADDIEGRTECLTPSASMPPLRQRLRCFGREA